MIQQTPVWFLHEEGLWFRLDGGCRTKVGFDVLLYLVLCTRDNGKVVVLVIRIILER